ncbi:hypothetical protein EDC04DRAFT_1861076 [Pisolithus marmoratus]|nr:hypothetical protein EDC04DRAFT_1861076 [Pisolithus marmoratus]
MGASAFGAQPTESSFLSTADTLSPNSRTQHRRNLVGPSVVLHSESAPQAKVFPPNTCTGSWEECKSINTKTLPLSALRPTSSPNSCGAAEMTECHALSGLARSHPSVPLQGVQDDGSGVTTKYEEHTVCALPVRNTYIPSMGNCARSLDVARAASDTRKSSLICLSQGHSTSLHSGLESDPVLAPSTEERKSNYEMLPGPASPAVRDEIKLFSTSNHTLSRATEMNDIKEGHINIVAKPLERPVASNGSGVVQIGKYKRTPKSTMGTD